MEPGLGTRAILDDDGLEPGRGTRATLDDSGLEPGLGTWATLGDDGLEPGLGTGLGKGGCTHLVSPAMAAAAGVAGHFVDIREW